MKDDEEGKKTRGKNKQSPSKNQQKLKEIADSYKSQSSGNLKLRLKKNNGDKPRPKSKLEED